MIIRKRMTEHQILFVVAILTGILLITIIAKGKIPENTIMNQALGSAFLEEGWNKKELFMQCVWSRGLFFVVIIIVSFSSLRKWSFRFMTIGIGMILGILIKLFYLWYGMKGIGLCLASLFPQYIFYWMGYGLIYWESDGRGAFPKRNYIPLLLTMVVVIMGIVLESYVNPILVNGYVKIFF